MVHVEVICGNNVPLLRFCGREPVVQHDSKRGVIDLSLYVEARYCSRRGWEFQVGNGMMNVMNGFYTVAKRRIEPLKPAYDIVRIFQILRYAPDHLLRVSEPPPPHIKSEPVEISPRSEDSTRRWILFDARPDM